MKGQANPKEKFLKAMQKDPHLAGIILNLKYEGIQALTNYGTLILKIHNPKTGIMVIIDPAKPYLFIKDNNDEGFNIPIQTAIRITLETYGTPQVEEIPKFGTNIPELNTLLKNLPKTP